MADTARAEADALLTNILPEPIAERLKERPDARVADSVDEASVMFSDLVGFTELAHKLGAARTVALLDQIVTEFDRLAARHGVEKIKTIGDGYMAVTGVSLPRADHLPCLARMALGLPGLVERLSAAHGVDLRVRVGIAIGPVMAGVIGTDKFSYDVWGETVNLASRLELHGLPGEIQVVRRGAGSARRQLRLRAARADRGEGRRPSRDLASQGGTRRCRDRGKHRGMTHTWRATVLTIFPEMFPGPLGMSLAGKALADAKWALDHHRHPRLRHRQAPLGRRHAGWRRRRHGDARRHRRRRHRCRPRRHASGVPTIYLSPRGRTLTQARVRELAQGPGAILLCGRFEGLDQRVLDARNVEEVSIGDYVLSGGELAAQVLIDACVRLLPGVAGNEVSLAEESFAAGLLEYPHYTRPRDWEGRAIPEVLLSGDHERIAKWRREQAEALTKERRPDLFAEHAKKK